MSTYYEHLMHTANQELIEFRKKRDHLIKVSTWPIDHETEKCLIVLEVLIAAYQRFIYGTPLKDVNGNQPNSFMLKENII